MPAKTCCGKFGLVMIESTGMSGRLPVLFAHVNEAQSTVHVTWNTWPGGRRRVRVEAADRRVADHRRRVRVQRASDPSTTSRIGRFGSTALPPVTFVQIAEFATPAPRFRADLDVAVVRADDRRASTSPASTRAG